MDEGQETSDQLTSSRKPGMHRVVSNPIPREAVRNIVCDMEHVLGSLQDIYQDLKSLIFQIDEVTEKVLTNSCTKTDKITKQNHNKGEIGIESKKIKTDFFISKINEGKNIFNKSTHSFKKEDKFIEIEVNSDFDKVVQLNNKQEENKKKSIQTRDGKEKIFGCNEKKDEYPLEDNTLTNQVWRNLPVIKSLMVGIPPPAKMYRNPKSPGIKFGESLGYQPSVVAHGQKLGGDLAARKLLTSIKRVGYETCKMTREVETSNKSENHNSEKIENINKTSVSKNTCVVNKINSEVVSHQSVVNSFIQNCRPHNPMCHTFDISKVKPNLDLHAEEKETKSSAKHISGNIFEKVLSTSIDVEENSIANFLEMEKNTNEDVLEKRVSRALSALTTYTVVNHLFCGELASEDNQHYCGFYEAALDCVFDVMAEFGQLDSSFSDDDENYVKETCICVDDFQEEFWDTGLSECSSDNFLLSSTCESNTLLNHESLALENSFHKYGKITSLVLNNPTQNDLVQYDDVDFSQSSYQASFMSLPSDDSNSGSSFSAYSDKLSSSVGNLSNISNHSIKSSYYLTDFQDSLDIGLSYDNKTLRSDASIHNRKTKYSPIWGRRSLSKSFHELDLVEEDCGKAKSKFLDEENNVSTSYNRNVNTWTEYTIVHKDLDEISDNNSEVSIHNNNQGTTK